MISIKRYTADQSRDWNTFASLARNESFLFQRGYMEYHSDRFDDHSLMIFNDGKLLALFPANEEGSTIYSHAGLTYGGLVIGSKWHAALAMEVFPSLLEYFHNLGFKEMIYKSMPAIYGREPFEEDRYALNQFGGELIARELSSSLSPIAGFKISRGKKSGIKMAQKHDLFFTESDDLSSFHQVLSEQLMADYNTTPVHTLEELKLLRSRFPENIHLFTVSRGGEFLAGTVIYETRQVAHAQYITSTSTGRDLHALDLLFYLLITDTYADKPWFDFGISTEKGGEVLNSGLIRFKEGFGARGVCYDRYRIKL